MRWLRTAAACLSVGTALYGCGASSTFRYDGSWMGNRNLKMRDVDKYTSYTIGRVTLTIKGNHFDLTEAGIPTGGKVAYQDDRATLETETYMERPLEQAGADAYKMHPTITILPQKDGSLVLDDPAAVDGKPVTLHRVDKIPG